jgi:hypothetical protein
MLRYGSYYAAFSLGRGVDGDVLEALRNLHGLVEVPAITVMRLFDCFKTRQTLSEPQFIEAIRLIESYVMRRAVCQEQSRRVKSCEDAPTASQPSICGAVCLGDSTGVFPFRDVA